MSKRNFKLYNHWIAEVREIGLENKVYFTETEDEDGKPRYATKSSIKYLFDKGLMFDYFKDGHSPQEAFDLETSNWSE